MEKSNGEVQIPSIWKDHPASGRNQSGADLERVHDPDEYIAVVDVTQYRADMDCFILLMERFYQTYGFYPKYPIADAGYGSYRNYIYCE